MTPNEILLSESQERMLIIAKRGKGNIVREVFEKWDVPCAEIGNVTDDGMLRVRNNGVIAAEIPARLLAEVARLYLGEANAPTVTAVAVHRTNHLPKTADHQALRTYPRIPTIASQHRAYA